MLVFRLEHARNGCLRAYQTSALANAAYWSITDRPLKLSLRDAFHTILNFVYFSYLHDVHVSGFSSFCSGPPKLEGYVYQSCFSPLPSYLVSQKTSKATLMCHTPLCSSCLCSNSYHQLTQVLLCSNEFLSILIDVFVLIFVLQRTAAQVVTDVFFESRGISRAEAYQ